MKNNSGRNSILIMLIVFFAILSFLGGLKETTVSGSTSDHTEGKAVVEYSERGYFPVFIAVFSTIELLLLYFSSGIAARIFGMLFHVFKVVAPIPLSKYISETLFGSITYIMPPSSIDYELSSFGHILMGLGFIILIVYLFDLVSSRE